MEPRRLLRGGVGKRGTHVDENCQASKESEKIKGESPTVRENTVGLENEQDGVRQHKEQDGNLKTSQQVPGLRMSGLYVPS